MGITKEDIARINELAKKSRTEEGLTEAEKEEQARLRALYIAAFRESLQGQLDSIRIREQDGTLHPLRPRKDGEDGN